MNIVLYVVKKSHEHRKRGEGVSEKNLNLCKDNTVCCDDDCLKCANRIYQEYKRLKEFIDELEYLVLHEEIEIAEYNCRDFKSYVNGANQFRFQIKNLIKKQKAVIK